ncbi:DUF885 domain-containing protein [Phytoactinopolyspora alkaliphila]|uniref:DUF885 domain-containing protein n=1 Tax=Phytoactinopolyspora alkaliphila TaxID=1783498 RepID=A0A6N9YQ08_9ACTN|nr:DUF885 domain-containing protein [Phytoactinopolyspora alkaliphila]NED97025.1 DUF885 domain-containing protein [Phytoactinopolyspora alkaliphila]
MTSGQPEPIRGIADDYLAELAELDPGAAEAIGRGSAVRVPWLGPDAFAQRDQAVRGALTRVRRWQETEAAGRASRADQLLGLALEERLTSDAALDEVGFARRLLAPLASPIHLVRQVFDDLPRETPEDYRVVAENLREVPRALREYAATLSTAAGRGHVVARRQVGLVADQIDAWVAADFYGGLVAGCPDAALTGQIGEAAHRATEASVGLAEWLRSDLMGRAPARDAVGHEVYQVTAGAFLGAEVDLDELYEWGWQELTRLATEARQVAAAICGEPDAAAAARQLDADPARRVPTGEPLRVWLQDRLDAVADAVDGRWFDIPAATRQVEARMTTAASGVMYYTPPDAALTRPGRVWWTVPDGTTHVATWREVSTVHHEGVPGHHLQHAVTYALTDLHPWQRLLCHVHGYAEGWAHYAEQLAGEIGLLDDPGDRLGQIHAQLWRACRIVIDLGLHLELPIPAGNGFVESETWTPEAGAEMLHRVAGVDPQTARFEVDRYLGWPGQALAFKVGSRLWHQVREEAQRARGSAFDLRTFHAEALALGPMGLDPLRAGLAMLTAERTAET